MGARARRVVVLVAVPIVIVSGLCSGGWWSGTSRGALDAEIAALRARGEPAGVEDLRPAPGTEELDGGALLREAWAWLDAHGPPEAEWAPLTDLCSHCVRDGGSDVQERYRAFAEHVEPFVELVERAAAQPRVRLGPPLRGDEPVVDQSRTGLLSRTLLVLRGARLGAWRDGDHRRYAGLLRLQAELAARVEITAGSGEAVRVAQALQSVLLDAADDVDAGACSAAEVDAAASVVLDVDPHALLVQGLRVDRALWLTRTRRLCGDEDGAAAPDLPAPVPTPWTARSLRSGAIAFSRAVDGALAAAPGDDPATMRRMSGWLERGNPYWVATFDQGEACHAAARILPVYALRETLRLRAIQRLFRVARASWTYVARDAVLPASLDDLRSLDPDLDTTDPFTGRPLECSRLPDSLVVGSAGATDPAIWGREAAADAERATEGLVWTLRW